MKLTSTFSGMVNVAGRVDITQMLTLSSSEDLNPERWLSMSNQTAAQQYAVSACSACKEKAKSRGSLLGVRGFVTALMQDFCV